MSADAATPSWQQAVVRSRIRSNRLILTYADGGYAPFVQNFAVGLLALRITEFVVVALDHAAWSLLGRLQLQAHAIHFGLDDASPTHRKPHAVSWYDDGYKRLMGSQPARVAAVYGYGGFDLLVADADVVWRASPWPLLYAPARAGCELQAMRGASKGSAEAFAALAAGSPLPPSPLSSPVREPHPSANCAACLNAGFLFLRGGRPAVGELLRRWSALLRQRRDEDHNQKWLNWVLATGGELRPDSAAARAAANGSAPGWAGAPVSCTLEAAHFPNGALLRQLVHDAPPSCGCRGRRDCAAPRAALAPAVAAGHLNFALAAREKVCTAKAWGLWLLSADAAHRESFDVANRTELAAARRRIDGARADVGDEEGRVIVPARRGG